MAAKAAIEARDRDRAAQARRDRATKSVSKVDAKEKAASTSASSRSAQASKEKASTGTSAGRSGGRDQQGSSSGGSNATRRAEGGLISRPEKTTRNKKGLAS